MHIVLEDVVGVNGRLCVFRGGCLGAESSILAASRTRGMCSRVGLCSWNRALCSAQELEENSSFVVS